LQRGKKTRGSGGPKNLPLSNGVELVSRGDTKPSSGASEGKKHRKKNIKTLLSRRPGAKPPNISLGELTGNINIPRWRKKTIGGRTPPTKTKDAIRGKGGRNGKMEPGGFD